MISKLCVNTGSVPVGRRQWKPFIEFYICISESIVIHNTYIYIYVHIYLLKTRLMRILKFTRQLVKPRCKRKVSIYLIYRINLYQLSWVFCKVLIVKLLFFLFNVLKSDTVMVLFLDIAILNFKMYQQMEEKSQNTLGLISHWRTVRTEMCGSGI